MRGDDRHRGRTRRAPHPVDELVLAGRAPLRRVRVVVQRVAALRDHAPAHGHRLQHEWPPPVAGRAHGVRGPRRRRRPHRGDDVPHVPRAPPPRGGARQHPLAGRRRALPPPGPRAAGAVLRRHLLQPPHPVPGPARAARRPRPPHRLRGRVPRARGPVRLPPAVAARQRLVVAQARPPRPGRVDRAGRPPDRADDGRRRRDRRLPRRARGHRRRRPLARRGRAGHPPRRRLRRLRDPAPVGRQRAGGGDRRLPGAAVGHGLRPRRGGPRRAPAAARADRPGDPRRRPGDVADVERRGRDRRRRRRAALRPRRRRRRPARRALVAGGRPRRPRRPRRGRAAADARLPGRAGPRLVGPHRPHRRGRPAQRGARLRVRRLGRRRAPGRRQPRLAARVRLARGARLVRDRAGRARRARRVVAAQGMLVATLAVLAGHFGLG